MANNITSRYGSASISVRKPLVEVKLSGPIHRIEAMLFDLDNCTTAGAMLAQKRTAERIKKDIRRHIREDGASLGVYWPALTKKTQKFKSSAGFSSKATKRWQFTGLLYNNIIIQSNRGNTVVTVRPNIKNQRTGGKATLAKIAMMLEYGTSKMPPRPLFKPVHKEYQKNGVLKSLTIWHIRNIIMVKHGVKAKIF